MSRTVSRHWDRACSYLRDRQLPAAKAQLESLRALAPEDARTVLLSARIAWQDDHVRVAAGTAVDAGHAAPEDAGLLCEVIDTLLETGETTAAHGLLDRPAWSQTDSVDALLRYANFRQDFSEQAAALAALDRLSHTLDGNGPYHFYRGQQLTFLGRFEEAEAEYVKCLQLAPDYGRAAYRLVRLRRQTPDRHHLGAMDAGMRQTARGSDQHAAFAFARHHVLDDLGRYDEAWDMLVQANAEMHALLARDAERQQLLVQRLSDWLMANVPVARSSVPDGPSPIFILGMPRSGTTLLERLLSNHSQVAAAGELVNFGQQLLWTTDTRFLGSDHFLARLAELDLAEVGRRYLLQTAWRACGRACFVDKLPANWLLAGLIQSALPQAKILHPVRDPMDVCFSAFRTMFSDGCTWSFDFATLVEHYRGYRQMLLHWHATRPGMILDVPYTDLVGNPETTLRKVLAFCGLDWEPGCEDVTRNTAPALSLSSVQVREPVHTRGLGLWRRYARQLEPLRQGLLAVS